MPAVSLGLDRQRHRERHARQRIGEAGRGEHRIAVDDHQRGDPPRLHVGHQAAHRGRLIDRIGLHRIDQAIGCVAAAQRLVHRMHQGVDFGRLGRAGMQQHAAVRGLQLG